MMHQLWTRRHVVQMLSFTGATLLHPILSWTQPQDTMAQPALQLLASCTATQRRQAMYPFEAKERRNWHYVPRRRPGLPLGAMTPTQQELLWGLLRAGLSEQQGVQKTRGVIATEAILRIPRHPSCHRPSATPAGGFQGLRDRRGRWFSLAPKSFRCVPLLPSLKMPLAA